MGDWQPIETAPKDGTPIMLFARCKTATAPVRLVGWYIEALGWIELSFSRPLGIEPLLWQPLPPMPPMPDESTDVVEMGGSLYGVTFVSQRVRRLRYIGDPAILGAQQPITDIFPNLGTIPVPKVNPCTQLDTKPEPTPAQKAVQRAVDVVSRR